MHIIISIHRTYHFNIFMLIFNLITSLPSASSVLSIISGFIFKNSSFDPDPLRILASGADTQNILGQVFSISHFVCPIVPSSYFFTAQLLTAIISHTVLF
jgi:hypothetical protein